MTAQGWAPHTQQGVALDQLTIGCIVVPIDEALLTERALPAVRALARALAAEVMLVRACESYSGLSSGNRGMPDTSQPPRVTSHHIQETLTLAERVLRSAPPSVVDRDRSCYPLIAVIEAAGESVSWIVMWTTLETDSSGQPALPNFAAEVVYHMEAPVLLAGPTTRSPFESSSGCVPRISAIEP